MKEVILIKNGEIALKGLNKSTFEEIMIKNMKHRLQDLGAFRFRKAQSTIYVEPQEEEIDLEEAVDRLTKVFGIAALSRAAVCEKDFERIKERAADYLAPQLQTAKTFKVTAKRSDKKFPLTSPQICEQLGEYLLGRFEHLSVDLHEPDLLVTVEIRDFAAYIHGAQIPGAGGMPVGSSGRALLLISGGIDSPVAGYMMAKRGLTICAVHFVSPPYTSERAKIKVIDLAKKISEYCGTIPLFIVPFTEIQEKIRDGCPEEVFTVVMRRFMMRISERICERANCDALVTGESLAQVASQTIPAIRCTEAVCGIPVLRPLIGMDKSEIIQIAHKIDTFETSILPYEDCCTVFTPRHPRTRPSLEMIERAEKSLDVEALVEQAVENVEKVIIR